MSGLFSVVVDGYTGAPLEGGVSDLLCDFCESGIRVLAYYSADRDEWVPTRKGSVGHAALRNAGYRFREVRVISHELVVERALDWLCELVNECQSRIENRNEAAYDRSLSDYYGGAGPQTDRERNEVSARGAR